MAQVQAGKGVEQQGTAGGQMQQQQQMALAMQQQLIAARMAELQKREDKKQKRIQSAQSQRAEMAAEKERTRQRNLEKLAERE